MGIVDGKGWDVFREITESRRERMDIDHSKTGVQVPENLKELTKNSDIGIIRKKIIIVKFRLNG